MEHVTIDIYFLKNKNNHHLFYKILSIIFLINRVENDLK